MAAITSLVMLSAESRDLETTTSTDSLLLLLLRLLLLLSTGTGPGVPGVKGSLEAAADRVALGDLERPDRLGDLDREVKLGDFDLEAAVGEGEETLLRLDKVGLRSEGKFSLLGCADRVTNSSFFSRRFEKLEIRSGKALEGDGSVSFSFSFEWEAGLFFMFASRFASRSLAGVRSLEAEEDTEKARLPLPSLLSSDAAGD